ncbi:MAG TPA: hypothetical protein DIT25_01290 [Candidatus Moranbacteria bacterium]|nr:hypothetical protein [Candidatus Moranbacteria bacterium]
MQKFGRFFLGNESAAADRKKWLDTKCLCSYSNDALCDKISLEKINEFRQPAPKAKLFENSAGTFSKA